MHKSLLLSFFLLFCLAQGVQAQCVGLRVVGFNSDNPDEILLGATSDIAAGTVFFITDNEWNGTAFNSGENLIQFTAPGTGIASGSTIVLTGTSATCGSINGVTPPLSTTGEEIYITSVNPVGNVAASNICSAVLFFGTGSISGIAESVNLGNIDNALFNGGNYNSAGSWTVSDEIINLPGACFPLPVRLVNFTAEKKQTAVSFFWTTATELNNAYFSIERSQDGTRFEAIGKVTGSGTSMLKQDYTFTDGRPLKGTNFYRLKQVDFDGQFSYSQVVSVNIGKVGGVRLSPQPVLDRLNVAFEEPILEAATWQVYDFAGRLLQSGTVESESTNFEISTTTLTEGSYVLRLVNGQQIITQQFQKN